MARLVLKFGGTSVADIERIRNVARHVKREVDAGHEVAVVVSAMSGTTNRLVEWCRDAAVLHDAREYDVVVASGGVNVPSINTREIATQVLVNDGQTVVLGGILETTQREDDTKVPYLGDIPILGHLFKNSSHQDNKDELMILITPKIVHEVVNVMN